MSDYDPNYVPQKQYFLVGTRCVVLNQQGQVLIVKRSDKVRGAGNWSLVGGAMDHGENPEDGIKREVQEEAQIEITDVTLIGAFAFQDQADYVLVLYFQAQTKGEVSLNWEHDEYKWITKDEIEEYNLSDRNKKFIKKAYGS